MTNNKKKRLETAKLNFQDIKNLIRYKSGKQNIPKNTTKLIRQVSIEIKHQLIIKQYKIRHLKQETT